MKHHNPHTPIMVREALNTQPRVFARYEFGREKVEELGGKFTNFLFCPVGEKRGLRCLVKVGYCDCGWKAGKPRQNTWDGRLEACAIEGKASVTDHFMMYRTRRQGD